MLKTCPQLRTQLATIKALYSDYCLELEQVKTSKEYETIFGIQKEMEANIKKLQELMKISLEKAREIMGTDFLGPEAVETVWGVKLEAKDIPPIPFSNPDLERAKELNQQLVLRVDKASDGSSLTMQKINEYIQPKLTQGKHGNLLFNIGWYAGEDFYTSETPQTSWALVSKEVIPDSMGKNYLEQTEVLVDYIQNSVFKDVTMPQEYAYAIAEFEAQKTEIAGLIDTDWQEAARRLAELKLNQLTRQTPVEALYDLPTNLLTNNDRLLESTYTCTNRRDSDGELVRVGSSDANGAGVGASRPGYRNGRLGVFFSRSR